MVGNVNRIVSVLLELRSPGDGARIQRFSCFVLILGRKQAFYLHIGTHLERVLAIGVALLRMRKTRLVSLCPRIRTCRYGISVFLCIIVDDYLNLGPVSFLRKKDNRSSILEHRNKERLHIAHGVSVFNDSEQPCPLELPAVKRRLVIPSVAVLHSDMPVLQAFGYGERLAFLLFQPLFSGRNPDYSVSLSLGELAV